MISLQQYSAALRVKPTVYLLMSRDHLSTWAL